MVSKVRKELGLDVDATNAPAVSMMVPKEIVALPPQYADELCYAFQHVALTHVEDRIHRALEVCRRLQIPITALVVVGGVAANAELRKRLGKLVVGRFEDQLTFRKPAGRSPSQGVPSQTKSPIPLSVTPLRLVFPPVELCTDNGVMVAWAGIEKFNNGLSDPCTESPSDHKDPGYVMEVIPRWPIGHLVHEDSDVDVVVCTVLEEGNYERHITASEIRSVMEDVPNYGSRNNNHYDHGQ
jgi:hypothetical protein